jgi:hypothetical protein
LKPYLNNLEDFFKSDMITKAKEMAKKGGPPIVFKDYFMKEDYMD